MNTPSNVAEEEDPQEKRKIAETPRILMKNLSTARKERTRSNRNHRVDKKEGGAQANGVKMTKKNLRCLMKARAEVKSTNPENKMVMAKMALV